MGLGRGEPRISRKKRQPSGERYEGKKTVLAQNLPVGETTYTEGFSKKVELVSPPFQPVRVSYSFGGVDGKMTRKATFLLVSHPKVGKSPDLEATGEVGD